MDLAIIAVPADVVLPVIKDCAQLRLHNKTFEKCSVSFKFKDNSAGQRNWTAVKLPARARDMDVPRQRENFNHRNTFSILRIKLKLHFVQNVESDTEIGRKRVFCKGLTKRYCCY